MGTGILEAGDVRTGVFPGRVVLVMALLTAALTGWLLEGLWVLEAHSPDLRILPLLWRAPLPIASALGLRAWWRGRPTAPAWSLTLIGFALLAAGRVAVPSLQLLEGLPARILGTEKLLPGDWLFWWEPRFGDAWLALPALAGVWALPGTFGHRGPDLVARLAGSAAFVALFSLGGGIPGGLGTGLPAALWAPFVLLVLWLAAVAFQPPGRRILAAAARRFLYLFAALWLVCLGFGLLRY